jgi:diacylglycerol kinase (ATP)
MKVALIINPVSGRKRSVIAADAAEPILREAGWEVTRKVTQCAGDATRIAREAAEEGFDLVITCGGDGSFSQALAGLLDTGVPAGLLPTGTGNDFARTVGLSLDPVGAAEQIVRGQATRIDLFAVQSDARPGETLWCANIAGVGFDARVCERTNRRSRVTGGTLAYLVAVADRKSVV